MLGGKLGYLSGEAPAMYSLTWLRAGSEKADMANGMFLIGALEQDIRQDGSSDNCLSREKNAGSIAYSHNVMLALGAISSTLSRAQGDSVVMKSTERKTPFSYSRCLFSKGDILARLQQTESKPWTDRMLFPLKSFAAKP